MLAQEFSIREEFPAVSYEDWRKLAEADLNGASFEQRLVTHSYEGIDIRPVYTRADRPATDPQGFPGFSPAVRGGTPLGASQSGWDVRQEHAHPDLTVTNQAILDDLRGGVTSLLLRFDLAGRNGFDPTSPAAADLAGRDGLMIYTLDDLDAVLKDVYLQMIGISLEAGAAFMPAAAMLVALWRRRGVSLAAARGAFNADPLAVLVRDGQLPMCMEDALAQLAELAVWTSINCPDVTSVRVGTAPYHHAGATAAQDIAFSMGTAIAYLRAMTARGLSIDQATRQLLFSVSLGTHHFLAIAKLRALRRLWSRVLEACGAEKPGPMRIHARTSKRVLTQRDPYVNLLRNTSAVFAACVGGADVITSVPFDSAIGLPDALSRRVARNTPLVLQEEANLHRVVDPAGGSWYLDWLTGELGEKAWNILQEIERQGGMVSTVQTGWVAQQIENAFAPRAKNLARRKEGITGVSEFPNIGEESIVRPAPDLNALRSAAKALLAAHGARKDIRLGTNCERIAAVVEAAERNASIGAMSNGLGLHIDTVAIPPLAPHPFAEPFEDLRDASDTYAAAHEGRRPRAFLASMGPVAHYTARTTYAKNFLEAGGFEVIQGEGYRDADEAARGLTGSGAAIAVICSSDKLYPELIPELAPKLKAAAARTVVLAGHPGANEVAWRRAGVDRFIFMKCDVLSTLRDMLREEGVRLP